MSQKQQSGVALITVLLVFAITAFIAVGMINRQTLDIRKTTNQLLYIQACEFALGGEELAKEILWKDWDDQKEDDDKRYDSLDEDWASNIPPLLFPEGAVSLKIDDLQGRFNLNTLILNPEPEQTTINTSTRSQLLELLEELVTDDRNASDMQHAFGDWIDANSEEAGVDTEEDAYLRLEPAYRTADAVFNHPSEMLLLTGIDADFYELLKAEVTVLPAVDTAINVNTASAKVLSSIYKKMSISQADTLIEKRKEEAFDELSKFEDEVKSVLAGGGTEDGKNDSIEPLAALAVTSDYFLASTHATFAGRDCYLRSLLHRDPDSGELTVRGRDRSDVFEIVPQKDEEKE